VHSVFCESTVNLDIIVSFHHKLVVKRLENDENERQLKCKICDVGLCIFGCFKNYHTKARFSYWTWRVKPIYTSSKYLQKMYVY
jgi:hypothetical protein